MQNCNICNSCELKVESRIFNEIISILGFILWVQVSLLLAFSLLVKLKALILLLQEIVHRYICAHFTLRCIHGQNCNLQFLKKYTYIFYRCNIQNYNTCNSYKVKYFDILVQSRIFYEIPSILGFSLWVQVSLFISLVYQSK